MSEQEKAKIKIEIIKKERKGQILVISIFKFIKQVSWAYNFQLDQDYLFLLVDPIQTYKRGENIF